jgi:hypothetical protein
MDFVISFVTFPLVPSMVGIVRETIRKGIFVFSVSSFSFLSDISNFFVVVTSGSQGTDSEEVAGIPMSVPPRAHVLGSEINFVTPVVQIPIAGSMVGTAGWIKFTTSCLEWR